MSVWQVYDELRTAQLNVYYYEGKRRQVERLQRALDIAVGITTCSAVAALSVWNTSPGKYIWAGLGVLGSLASITKPTLRLDMRIGAYEESAKGYSILAYDLRRISEMIREARASSSEHKRLLSEAMERRRALIEKELDRSPDEALARRCQARVNRELPAASFYVPATEVS
jgi:hypothetical protein